jgi:hypothetical protein
MQTVPLRLIMHGFTDYFTVTSIFAAYQGGVGAVVPFLEIQEPNGQWKKVSDDIGFPAGLARTMVADLSGRLPSGTRRIRIGTNLKSIGIRFSSTPPPQTSPVDLHEVPLVRHPCSFEAIPERLKAKFRATLSTSTKT